MQEPGERTQDGRFSATGWTEQDDDLTGPHVEVDLGGEHVTEGQSELLEPQVRSAAHRAALGNQWLIRAPMRSTSHAVLQPRTPIESMPTTTPA